MRVTATTSASAGNQGTSISHTPHGRTNERGAVRHCPTLAEPELSIEMRIRKIIEIHPDLRELL